MENTCGCVLGPWPWPREGLSSERLSLALASDIFCVLGLGLEPCVLDSTSGFKHILNEVGVFNLIFDSILFQILVLYYLMLCCERAVGYLEMCIGKGKITQRSTSPKDPIAEHEKSRLVYKIPCADSEFVYGGKRNGI